MASVAGAAADGGRVARLLALALGTLGLGLATGCSGYIESESIDAATADDSPRNTADTGFNYSNDTGNSWSGDTGTSGDTGGQPTSGKDPKKLAKQAMSVLETHCTSCHGAASAAKGGFSGVTNAEKLKKSGQVDPWDPSASPLYKRMSDGSMPPNSVSTQPTASEIDVVKQWINAGAPPPNDQRKRIGIDQKLSWMEKDIRSIQNPSDRKDIRYISLVNMHNGNISDQKLDHYRDALSFTLNSLSRGRSIVRPKPIDKAKTVYKIDLDDYGWDARTWERIIAEYPYSVSYDENSRIWGYDETAAGILREDTGTTIPYVQADWLITHATQAPLYYEILELPRRLSDLERQLGLDIDQNIREEQVERAGFNNSGPSEANRVIERHELDGGFGAFWVSYDFENSRDERNIFANPFALDYPSIERQEGDQLQFREDGGEFIFTLPNGLQGYYIANAQGVRANKAPNNLVTHQDRPDNQVQAGVSCMGCHNEKGIIPKSDEIRQNSGNFTAAAREKILALYPPKNTFAKKQKEDGQLFLNKKKLTGVDPSLDKPIMRVVLAHEDTMSLTKVANVLGVPVSKFKNSLKNAQDAPKAIQALVQLQQEIPREVFDDTVQQLVCALGLGRPVDVRRDGHGAFRTEELSCSRVLNN